MTKMSRPLKVALVTESLWSMGGANRVLESFAKLYPESDIYALFGDVSNLSDELKTHKIVFSELNRRPLINVFYRYTYHLWPLMIEKFSFDKYDLVISSSASVAFGVITGNSCKHIAYIHSPMRYLWDLKDMGSNTLGGFKRIASNFFLTFLRVWEVSASSRPDILITNSKFVKDRVYKYWKRKADYVLTPPIHFYKGDILEKRDKYIVAGAPFEFNKKGDFLLKCISDMDIDLKIIGSGSMKNKLQRKYRKYKNIEFLGNITDEEKWKIFSKASCFVMPGIEDYGIFPIEAMSAGTPVLAYMAGGICENLIEGVNGYFFTEWNLTNFEMGIKKVLENNWDYTKIAMSVRGNNNSEELFKKKFEDISSF